jgi:hypothetical protein
MFQSLLFEIRAHNSYYFISTTCTLVNTLYFRGWGTADEYVAARSPTLEPAVLDFGDVRVGTSETRELTLFNCTGCDVQYCVGYTPMDAEDTGEEGPVLLRVCLPLCLSTYLCSSYLSRDNGICLMGAICS